MSKFMQFLFIILLALSGLTVGCTHTIDFRSSHFAVPHVNEKQWAGNISISVAQPTEVTLISDKDTNPPGRVVGINDDVSLNGLFETMLTIDLYATEIDLTIAPQVEFFNNSSLYGLRWQFLGYSAGANSYVASLQAAFGSFSSTSGSLTNSPPDKATTNVSTEQYGLSFGYKWDKVIAYLSYIQDTHNATTNVTNANGDFGPYSDSGVHQTASLGVSSHSSSFLYGIEINGINAKWNNSISDASESVGVRLGYQW